MTAKKYFTPVEEITTRWDNYRKLLRKYIPKAEGSFIFSRLNIFYLTGSFANGILWLPVEGEPILFCRRGIERANIETPLKTIVPFGSYRDILSIFADFGIKPPVHIAAEMNVLPWALSKSLTKNMPGVKFTSCDKLIAMTRAVKSEWELHILREAGRKHCKCITQLLPPLLHEGISELEVAHKVSDLFFSEGHNGILRMETYGEELFFGQVSMGDNGNFPTVFNGPNGNQGVHPAAPYMGSAETHWAPETPLLVDNGFNISGYQTDKTQIYWLGNSMPESVQKAFDFCVEVQNTIAEQLRPGAIPSELWNQTLDMAAKSPWNDGFMGLGKNKVKFLGHGIGLAIDEYPVIAKGFDQPLEAGMTLALEPKLGLPGVGMVGIENTFEVTDHGGQSITGNHFETIKIH